MKELTFSEAIVAILGTTASEQTVGGGLNRKGSCNFTREKEQVLHIVLVPRPSSPPPLLSCRIRNGRIERRPGHKAKLIQLECMIRYARDHTTL